MSTVRVVMTGHGRGQVFVDGVEQKRLTGFKIEAAVGELNKVTIDFIADEIEFEGEAIVE